MRISDEERARLELIAKWHGMANVTEAIRWMIDYEMDWIATYEEFGDREVSNSNLLCAEIASAPRARLKDVFTAANELVTRASLADKDGVSRVPIRYLRALARAITGQARTQSSPRPSGTRGRTIG